MSKPPVSTLSHTDVRGLISRVVFDLDGKTTTAAACNKFFEDHKHMLVAGDFEMFRTEYTKSINRCESRYRYQLRYQVHPQMSNPSIAKDWLLIKPMSESGRGIWELRDDAPQKMLDKGIITKEEFDEYMKRKKGKSSEKQSVDEQQTEEVAEITDKNQEIYDAVLDVLICCDNLMKLLKKDKSQSEKDLKWMKSVFKRLHPEDYDKAFPKNNWGVLND